MTDCGVEIWVEVEQILQLKTDYVCTMYALSLTSTGTKLPVDHLEQGATPVQQTRQGGREAGGEVCLENIQRNQCMLPAPPIPYVVTHL